MKISWVSFFERLPLEKNILVVTSNGIARFVLMACDNEHSHELKLKTGAYGIVEIEQGCNPKILEWNIRP